MSGGIKGETLEFEESVNRVCHFLLLVSTGANTMQTKTWSEHYGSEHRDQGETILVLVWGTEKETPKAQGEWGKISWFFFFPSPLSLFYCLSYPVDPAAKTEAGEISFPFGEVPNCWCFSLSLCPSVSWSWRQCNHRRGQFLMKDQKVKSHTTGK